jgi:NADPH-dependent F420 reductase
MARAMVIGLVGGTGKEGRGLGLRWARAGHDVRVGSRDGARGEACAVELAAALGATGRRADGAAALGGRIAGGGNDWAVTGADVVVLCVPYAAHAATVATVRDAVQGKVVIDITVPLAPPKVRQVTLPAGQSAALEAQAAFGARVRVVAALHHVSSAHLGEPDAVIDCDVLVCGDDASARALAIELIGDLGVRGLDAGPLCNAVALESLTPVLLHMNKHYRSAGTGLRITGLPSGET